MYNRLEEELKVREKSLGLRVADLFALPDALARLLSWMIRQKQVQIAEINEFVGDEAAAKDLLVEAMERGLVRQYERHGAVYYRVRMAPKPAREGLSNLWDTLLSKIEDEGGAR